MAGRCNASQDAHDAWDGGDASLASGRNADGSDAGSVFADVVASLLVILPLSSSRFSLLAPLLPLSPSWLASYCPLPIGWHPTATLPLAPYCYTPAGTLLLIVMAWHPLCPLAPHAFYPLRSVDPSSVTPSRGIALLPWLLSNALDRYNDLSDRTTWFRRALKS